ncbi:MAG: YHS domain-containing protein [Candidatus Omnitrophica bacterium]|nr:YHS domain-containing protein [Candidatus Omnitrophota bacterium]
MKKILFVVIVSGVLFMASAQAVKAQNVSEATKTGVDASKPQDVGNKMCPVTGLKIDEKTKATYEYKGKIYNFCCAMCIDEFKKDPEKYIKKVEEEM